MIPRLTAFVAFCYELMWEALGQLKNTDTGVVELFNLSYWLCFVSGL